MKKMLVIVVCVLFTIGCGSDGSDNAADPTTAASPSPLGPQRTEEGVPGPLPARAESSDDVDSDVHTGQEVFITADGFAPKQLYAKQNAEIRFYNETDDPQEIVFTNLDWRSGRIEPGAFGSYAPDQTISITFALASDDQVTGNIQVSAYYEPGETAEPEANTTE